MTNNHPLVGKMLQIEFTKQAADAWDQSSTPSWPRYARCLAHADGMLLLRNRRSKDEIWVPLAAILTIKEV